MRKNPTTLVSSGRGELGPTNPPPVTPPIAPPGGIRPVTPPVILNPNPPGNINPVTPPLNPPGGGRGESPGSGGFQVAPPLTPGLQTVKDVLTPGGNTPPDEEKKMNQLFIFGGIALALYLLFK